MAFNTSSPGNSLSLKDQKANVITVASPSTQHPKDGGLQSLWLLGGPRRWGGLLRLTRGLAVRGLGAPGQTQRSSGPAADCCTFGAGLASSPPEPHIHRHKKSLAALSDAGRASRLSHRQTMLAPHRAPAKKPNISLNKSSTDLVALPSIKMRGSLQRKERWQLKP